MNYEWLFCVAGVIFGIVGFSIMYVILSDCRFFKDGCFLEKAYCVFILPTIAFLSFMAGYGFAAQIVEIINVL